MIIKTQKEPTESDPVGTGRSARHCQKIVQAYANHVPCKAKRTQRTSQDSQTIT